MKRRYAVLFLLIFILISSSALVSLSFFSKYTKSEGFITLKEIDFNLICNIENNKIVMPGDTINANINLVNSKDMNGNDYESLVDILVRFKFGATVNNSNINIIPKFNDEINIYYSNDYFYFLKKIAPGEQINLLESFSINKDLTNEYSNNKMVFFVLVEAIQCTEDAVMDLWPEVYEKINNIF